jgi:hypothetical protein
VIGDQRFASDTSVLTDITLAVRRVLRPDYNALPVVRAGPQSYRVLVDHEYDNCHDKDYGCCDRPAELILTSVEPSGGKHQPDYGSRTKLGHTSPNHLVSRFEWWRDHEGPNYADEEPGRAGQLGPVSL